jgi:hypothetical protein
MGWLIGRKRRCLTWHRRRRAAQKSELRNREEEAEISANLYQRAVAGQVVESVPHHLCCAGGIVDGVSGGGGDGDEAWSGLRRRARLALPTSQTPPAPRRGALVDETRRNGMKSPITTRFFIFFYGNTEFVILLHFFFIFDQRRFGPGFSSAVRTEKGPASVVFAAQLIQIFLGCTGINSSQ